MTALTAGYDAAAWSEFAVGVLGAAAALAGLLFVAMSINVARILAIATLPARAACSLIQFVLPLLLSVCVSVPEQPRPVLGIELACLGGITGSMLLWLQRPSKWPRGGPKPWLLGSLALSVLVSGLTAVGGITVAIGHGGGLYWVAPAVVLAFATGLIGAWVLLIEILR